MLACHSSRPVVHLTFIHLQNIAINYSLVLFVAYSKNLEAELYNAEKKLDIN